MSRTTKATCPHCGSPLRSGRGVRVGKTVHCPRCAAAFVVRRDEAGPAPVAQPWAPPPPAAEIDGARLVLVLFVALVYLLGGGALAYYCLARSAPPPPAPPPPPVVQTRPAVGDADDGTAPPPPPRPVSLMEAAEQRKIDEAIVKGVWYLRDHALPEGSWGDKLPAGQAPVTLGFASLPALTLLECGVPASDPVIQKAAALVRKQAPPLHDVYDTYQRALAILFLDRLGDKQDEELIQYLSLCLVAGQHPTDGAWSYYCPSLDRGQVPQLLKQLEAAPSVAAWRKGALQALPPEWDQGVAAPKDWDNSNTQFALLALWVARRHHVSVERSILLAETHFRKTQLGRQDDPKGDNLNMDGSWYYARNGGSGWQNSSRWPSMTCAGLLGLAEAQGVSQKLKGKQKPLADPAVQRALAMLGREIDRPDEKRATDLYFLWSLERVGVLFHLPKIEGKDWYAWGSKTLLAAQQQDGSWKDGAYYDHTPVINTCFALLFLQQANLAADLTSKLQLLGAEK